MRSPACSAAICLATVIASASAQSEFVHAAPAAQGVFAITGPTAVEFPENSTDAIAAYGVTGATPGTTVAWDVGGTDARRFAIDATGALTFKSARDYEKPNDSNRDNSYEVEVSASAGSDSHSLEIIVTVTGVNEPPAFELETAELSVTENAPANRRVGGALRVTDPDDGDTRTFSLAGQAPDEFIIDGEGQIRARRDAVLDYEGSPTLNVTAVVTDQGGLSDSLPVVITLTDADDPGVVSFSSVRPSVGVAFAATVTDDDGVTGRVRWRWYRAENVGDEFSRIKSATRSDYTPVEEDQGYMLRVTVTYEDNFEVMATASGTSVAVTDNTAPVFDSTTASRTVSEEAPHGTAVGEPIMATDEDDDDLTYTLSGDDVEYFEIGRSSGQITVAVQVLPDADTKAGYNLSVTATDEAEETAAIAVTISVTVPNSPPTITGLASVNYPENDTTAVATYSITDPDGDALTWSVAGTDAARFSISEDGELTFRSSPNYEAPNDANADNMYEVTVRASDGNLMSTINVEVTVTDVNESGIITGPASVNYPENTAATVATYSITDPDGDALTWSIAGTDAARFSINEDGELTFRSSPDYEAPNDANTDNVYEVTVRASDGNLTATLDVEATVTDVNETGAITGLTSVNYPENGTTTIATYSITDPDGDALTWSIAGTDAARFSISATGELTFKSSPDYESPNDANTDNIYEVTVRVSDSDLMSTLNVEVTVTNANESGAITGLESISYAENDTTAVATYSITDPDGDALTWSIAGTDAAWFSISSSGELSFRSPPNYEAPNDANKDNIYEVTVRASDETLISTLDVEVTVTDVNETGAITGPTSIDYPENETVTIATYSITDPDGNDNTWSITGTDAARFSISEEGALTFRSSPDYEAPNDANKDNVYEVTVRASDDNLMSTLNVEVTVTDANESGVITGPTSVEHSENGTGSVATYSITDPDGDALTWSIAGTDAARFSISEDGELSFKSSPDYETPNDANKDNIYEVTVRASDDNLASTLNVEVTITNANESGPITGPTSVNYPENDTTTIATYSITDPDGNDITWSVAGTDAARFSINEEGALIFRSSPDYESPNDANKDNLYEVTVRASDGSLASSLNVEVTVTNANESGNITGPASVNYLENDTTAVATYSITDPEADAVTWGIAGTDAARFSISEDGELSFRSSPNYEAPNDANKDNVYEVTVRASDGNLTSTLDVEVTITKVNESGAITGPASVNFPENNTAPVATYAITDPDGDVLAWSIAGTDAVRFSISKDGELTFRSSPNYEAPNDANTDNIYEVTVRASDETLISTLNVEVTVTDANESGAITGLTSVNYPENGTTTIATYSITDPDGDALTWSIAGTDAAWFSISSSGELSFRSPPNYEAPNDANKDNIYEVTVRASDETLISTLDVEVTVTDVNETGAITGPTSIDYPENGTTIVATYSANDPEDNDITWSIADTDAERFSINATGELTFKSSPDYEVPNDANTDNIYEVTVRVSDSDLMSTLNVEVTVTDVNETGAITGPTSIDYPENGTTIVATYSANDPEDNDITWSIADTDAERFSINATGELTFKSSPDYEVPNDANTDNIYEVTVRASDGNLMSTINVEVTVTNANESGAITGLASITYAENDTTLVATYSITDPDGDGVTWTVAGTDAARFSISEDGELSFRSSPDYEAPNDANTDNIYEVTVRASDGNLMSTLEVEITVTDANESGPITGPASLNYAENGTTAVATYSVTDPDGDGVTWSVAGTDAARFSINATGELAFRSSPNYEAPNDANADNVYEVTVRASDGNLTATLDVEVTVTNANESGNITGLTSVNYPENDTTTVATYSITDPDGDGVTWSIAGTDAARFSINEDGGLTFRSLPDYEAPNDANQDNVYEVTVRASDGNLTATLDVEATVTDVNESGPITGPTSVNYPENSTATIATYAITDPEADAVTWSIAGTDAARFSINEDGGLTFRSLPDYEAPNDANQDNVYEVTVSASDGNLTSTLDVEVILTDTNESGIITGPTSVNYPENDTTTVATYSITDPDGDAVTWSVADTDAVRFSISKDGELTFRSSPNYESPNDANTDNVYEVTVRASDDNLMVTLNVEVTVTDANESGAVTGPTSVEHSENGTGSVATYSITDPEGDAVTWSIAGTDAARFSISEDGELSFRSPPNYEAPNDANHDNVYEVTIRASDGDLMSTLDVEITVTNANESGAITGPASVDYPENSTTTVATYSITDPDGDGVTWSVAGTDAARFSINEDGELSFRSSPDYEAPNDANKDNVYEVTIRASDGNLMSTLDVEVTVTDANESGAITGPTSIDYPENGIATIATYSITDPDGDGVMWSVAGTDAPRFSINEDGELSFRSSPNYEAPNDANTDNVYEVTVRASDGNLMSTLDVEVTVTDANESGIITGPTSVNYPENDTTAVATYSITDPESNDITWSVAGTDSARFSINEDGGLTFRSSPDYEAPNDANTDNVYEVTVRASDGNLLSTLDVEVTVTDANESGVITGPTSTDYPENGTGTVATYSATDPDGDDVTWSVAGTDAARFSINENGKLTFKSSPDYEAPNDANKDNVYEVTIRASDGSLMSTLDVEVTITDANESGAIIGPASVEYPENGTTAVATYSITDPESNDITWSVAGTDAARFSISEDGELSFCSSPDYEAPNDANQDNVYEVTVRASDSDLMSTLDVEVTITDANESGNITGPESINYEENGTGAVATYSATDPEDDDVTWSIAGTDAARFSISTDGTLAFLDPPNFEMPLDSDGDNVYEVQIHSGGDEVGGDLSVKVEVKDANDAPRFLSANLLAEIPENSCPGAHTIYRGIAGDDSAETDEDGDLLTYALSGADEAAFVIHPPTGHITLGPGFPLDFESGRSSFALLVAVSDGRNNSGVVETEFIADDFLELTVVISDVNEAPVFAESQLKLDACGRPIGYEPAQLRRTVISGSPGRTPVGAPVKAIDPEGKIVSFGITAQSEVGTFIIDSKSGQLMLAPDFAPRDARRVYTLRVAATDGVESSHIEVRIEVLPTLEPTPEPHVEPSTASRADPTPIATQTPKAAIDLPTQDVFPASKNTVPYVVLTRPPLSQTAEQTFIPVEGAAQVPQFGKATVQDAAGRARLVAPAGALASAYQVRLTEDSAVCSQLGNLHESVTCVCISVEFFEASGEPLARETLNRAALLEIVLQMPDEMNTKDGDEVLQHSPTGSFEMVTRQDQEGEWQPTRLSVRGFVDGPAIVMTQVTSPGQYMAVRSVAEVAEVSSKSGGSIDFRHIAGPARTSDEITVDLAPRPVSFVNNVAVAQQPAQQQLQPPTPTALGHIGSLLIALLFDVTMVLAAGALLHKLMFP